MQSKEPKRFQRNEVIDSTTHFEVDVQVTDGWLTKFCGKECKSEDEATEWIESYYSDPSNKPVPEYRVVEVQKKRICKHHNLGGW